MLITTKAYLGNEAATHDAITPDGWFKTGDIATRDAEGFYYIVDRRKELIKYKVIDHSLVLWNTTLNNYQGFQGTQMMLSKGDPGNMMAGSSPSRIRKYSFDAPSHCRRGCHWSSQYERGY